MPESILDVFNQDAFNVLALTGVINQFTPQYGVLGKLGVFTSEGQLARSVVVDFDRYTNAIVPQSAWGGPAVVNKSVRPQSKSFPIPHFPMEDSIQASDLQGQRQPGATTLMTAQYLMAKKLREMRGKLDQTLEWLRLGVLKGDITDGAGNVIANAFTALGTSQTALAFLLTVATTEVSTKCSAAKRAMEKALYGENYDGMIALCSDTFYDAFTTHATVKDSFKYWNSMSGQNLAGDYRKGFRFGEVVWINYTGSVPDASGTLHKMIEDDSAYLLPTGTTLFKDFLAPADYMETVNTIGQPFYAKQELTKFAKGIDIEVQSNPLPMCLKPGCVIKLTIS